jgi:hypothetical protein
MLDILPTQKDAVQNPGRFKHPDHNSEDRPVPGTHHHVDQRAAHHRTEGEIEFRTHHFRHVTLVLVTPPDRLPDAPSLLGR